MGAAQAPGLGAALMAALLLVIAVWAISLRVQIVRRIAAESAMRAVKEEAEAANRAKSMFLAMMSHEIRRPMNAVLDLLELELRVPGDRAATERALTTAHRAARDLLGMIDDLLDSKDRSGTADIDACAVGTRSVGRWCRGYMYGYI